MKNTFYCWPLALALIMLVTGCQEIPIVIPHSNTGQRNVLVEELTGVRCQNCPDGTRELVSLQNDLGVDNLIIVSIHAAGGTFSIPFTTAPANQYDFRFPEAQTLANFIGSADGYPTASINRHLVDGNTSPFSPRSAWPSLINDEFAQDFGLNLFLNTAYDPATRQLDINLNIAPDQTLAGENRLTVVITQDSIVDVQQDGAVKNPNYIHRHVLRKVVSAPTGDVINEALTANALVKKTYSLVLPDDFKAEHCSVVAFVHHSGNPDKDVLQVTEAHVVQ
ncbi:MAG: Omp28 family outer membrane lipoprotein [Saprospiraceae bacterium]